MILFSVLCLLKATAPQALQMEHVSGNIYRTKPPHQIAAFADAESNALAYAKRLKDKRSTSAATAVNAVVDKFYIEKAHQTEGGWIVYHTDNGLQTGRRFESYVVSAVASWETLSATISSTLANFMRDYKIAFPTLASNSVVPVPDASIVVDQLLGLRTKPADQIMEQELALPSACPQFVANETGMKQVLSCHASLQILYRKLEARLESKVTKYAEQKAMSEDKVSRLYQIVIGGDAAGFIADRKRLKAQDITDAEIVSFKASSEGQAISSLKICLNTLTASSLPKTLEKEMTRIWHSLLDAKAKETGGLVFDAVDHREFKEKCLQDKHNLEEELLAYLKSKTMFFRFQRNGVWESAGITNNCIFASIGQTPGAVEKLVQRFIPDEAARRKPASQTWVEFWTDGGRWLRQCILGAFSMETDTDLLAELCAKESHVYAQNILELREKGQSYAKQLLALLISYQRQIVFKYQLTSAYLPLWLHDYIGRKVQCMKICCFIQPDDQKSVLASQAEVDLKGMAPDSVFVLNQLTEANRLVVASGLMPATAGYHYDGLQYVRTGW